MSGHPSFLELDRLAASGADPSSHPHVASCDACQQHLSRLGTRVAVPAWVSGLSAPRPRPFWAGWGLPALAGVAAVALLLILTPSLRTRDPGYAVKGGPSVVVHLKRGEAVQEWAPGQTVQPGDVLRLELSAPGLSHYAVLTQQDGAWKVLATGRLSAAPTLLPEAWRLDAAGREEVLQVVFSASALPEAESIRAAVERTQREDRWTISLVLPKAGGQ